jgi:hypothetical protein
MSGPIPARFGDGLCRLRAVAGYRSVQTALCVVCFGIACSGVAVAGAGRYPDAEDGGKAPNVSPYEVIGHIGGAEISFSNTLVAAGNRLYLGLGPRLAVVDVFDPADPRQIGLSELLPRAVRAVVLRDDVAFVALADHGVAALDLTDAARPRVIGRAATTVDAYGLAINGDRLFVAGNDVANSTAGQLAVFAIGDPTRIEPLGELPLDGECLSVVVRGENAYVGCGSRAMHVVDVRDPTRLQRLASLPHTEGISDIGLLGSYVVLPYDFGLDIVDVSDPRNPRVLSRRTLPDITHGIAVAGDRVYVAYYQGINKQADVQVFDAHQPTAPRLEATLDTSGLPIDLVVQDGRAYVTYRQKNLTGTEYVGVMDVADLARPREVGGLKAIGQIGIVAAPGTGNVIYAGKNHNVGPSRLHAIDMSDPREPALLGSLDGVLDGLWDLAFDRDYVYTADGLGGLRVIDADDPAHLRAVGHLDLSVDNALSVDVSAGRAYVGTSIAHTGQTGGTLFVVDVSDATQPALLGWLYLPDAGWSVTVRGDVAYVGVGSSGLWLVDVADPRAPKRIATAPSAGWVINTIVRDNLAFAYGSGVHVIDVADPAHPREISFLGGGLSLWGMAVAGPRVYLAEQGRDARWQRGLHVFDIADPAQPVDLGWLETPGEAWDVAASNGLVYVADNFTGLTVVRGGDDAVLAPTPTATPWPMRTSESPTPTVPASVTPAPSATQQPDRTVGPPTPTATPSVTPASGGVVYLPWLCDGCRGAGTRTD